VAGGAGYMLCVYHQNVGTGVNSDESSVERW
jgi:hypothetical protein